MNKIESYLSRVDKKQKGIIYVIVTVIILFIAQALWTPLSEKKEQLENTVVTLQNNIAKDSINSIKKEIAYKQKELAQTNSIVETQKEKIASLMAGIYSINYAFFNEKELANLLNEMLTKSLNSGLHIDFIRNIEAKKVDGDTMLKHKKSMEISGSGGYKEIVGFINHIENLNFLIKFTTIKLYSAEETVKFSIGLDFYGIGL